MEFWVRRSAAILLCRYIDKVEKLKLDPEKLDKKGPEHCPRWDDFTEGKHWKFGKTNNFKKYEKLIPKYPPKYYATSNGRLDGEPYNADFKRQLKVERAIEERIREDWEESLAWIILRKKNLNKEQVSKIAKKCRVSEDYVKGLIKINKTVDKLLKGTKFEPKN